MLMARLASKASVSGERGSVLVMIALFLPIAILFVAFVVDVGNWFDHKRHLQLQADAGALATAQSFNSCFSNMDTGDGTIYQFVGKYGGATTVYTPSSVKSGPLDPFPGAGLAINAPIYNSPVAARSSSNNDYTLVNSQTYANQASPVDTDVPSSNADPCNAAMADVKVTETNLPWYMQALSVPFINAHARVSILEETSQAGALPVAARSNVPAAATAYFVDESTGSLINTCGASGTAPCTTPLSQDASGNWSNASAALPMNVTTSAIGVRVALSGDPTTTTCGSPSVVCYDSTNSHLGVLHVQGWSGNGAGGDGSSGKPSPVARKVTLVPDLANSSACSDAHFSSGTSPVGSNCTVGVQAIVNFGTGNGPPAGAEVDAVVNGGTCYPLGYVSTSGTDETWSSTATPPAGPKCATSSQYPQLTANSGSSTVDLQVWDTALGKSGNKPNYVNVSGQRAYTSSTTATAPAVADPIQSATLTEAGGSAEVDNAQVCETGHTTCAHNFVVTIGAGGDLQNNTGQLQSLRVVSVSGNGSQSQEIDCGGGNIAAELQNGCTNPYAKNTSPTLSCTPGPNPPQCVALQTGEAVGQVSKGLNNRFADTAAGNCNGVFPNNTVNGVWNGQPDPRIVQVFVTPFGSFSGSGNGLVPILKFATMYVAGWSGDPCLASNPGGTDPADPAGNSKGDIWGYFINYINSLGTSVGGGKCVAGTFGTCVAVLTQ